MLQLGVVVLPTASHGGCVAWAMGLEGWGLGGSFLCGEHLNAWEQRTTRERKTCEILGLDHFKALYLQCLAISSAVGVSLSCLQIHKASFWGRGDLETMLSPFSLHMSCSTEIGLQLSQLLRSSIGSPVPVF